MRKVTSLLFVLLTSFLMFTASTSIGQVQVGDGTVVSKALPIEPFYGYTYSQEIYLASEINASGDITTLSFNFAGTSLSNSNDWTIYIGHTTKTEFASTTDWIDVATLTQVYSAVFTDPGGPGWIEFDITDFAYNGTDNIVVAVDENVSGYNGSGDDFYCTTVATNRGLVYRNDNTNPDPAAPPTATYNYPNIANIIFGGIAQACPTPTALMVDNVTTTSATLSWVAGGSELAWDVAYGEPGFDPDTEGTIVPVTENPYSLTGLTPASSYDVYVRADCGTDEVSSWSGVAMFNTLCETFTAPYSEDFENDGIIPNCWEQGATNAKPWKFANAGTGHIGNAGIMGGTTTSGGYFAWVDDSSPHDSTIMLSPFIDISGLSIPNLSFFLISNNEGFTNVDFWINLWDGSMWQEQIFFHNENTLNGEWQQFFIDLSAYTISGPIQLAFVVDENNGTDFYDDVAIDDVLVGEAPSCFPPTLFSAADFTTTSATFSWTPGGNEVAWDLAWGEPGFDPDIEGTIVPVTENPYLLDGLMAGTQYHAYLRADCGTDEVSTWVGPLNFSTELCEPTNQCSFSVMLYDSYGDGWNGNIMGFEQGGLITGTFGEGFETGNTFGPVDVNLCDGFSTDIVVANLGSFVGEVGFAVFSPYGELIFEWATGGTFTGTTVFYTFDASCAEPDYGALEGYVTEATRGPIENARVFSGDYEAFTDATGYYLIEDILPGTYDFTCEAEGYFSVIADTIDIVALETTTLDFELGYAQIAVNPANLEQTLEPDMMATQTLTISNPGGTEPLNWSASIELLEEAPLANFVPVTFGDPIAIDNSNSTNDICSSTAVMKGDLTDATWDILQSFSTTAASEQAVGTDGQYIYTTLWNGAGVFGKYELDGTFVENFTIAAAAGIRDFAYDGQYFYGGASGSTLFILDLNAQTLVGTIALQGGATCRHLAYDPTVDGFWLGNWTTLFQVDKTGAILQTGPAVVSVYGSAYDGVTPGGPYLWLFAQVGTDGCGDPVNDLVTLQQFDIATMSFTGVVHCATDLPGYIPGNATNATIAGGAFATDLLIPGKFVMMVNVQQSPNLIGVYELAELATWLTMDTYSGTVNPGESQDVTVTFDATGLVDTNYYANININHNGQELMDGTLSVPVEMIVASASAPAAPTNPMPVSGAQFVPFQPEFSWTNGAGTSTVRFVLVKETFPFATTIYTSPWFFGETLNLADVGITLLPKTNYSWRVTARNAAGTTAGTKWLFQTIGIGTIGGIVTDNYSGSPLENVNVSTDDMLYSAITAVDGTYLITGVIEGDYNVTAEKDGYVSQTTPTTVVHGQNSLVNFALDLYLEPPFGLSANVEDFVNVNLAWNAPGGAWTPEWLTYSQEAVSNSIGTNAAANFDVAARFTPDQLTEFPGGSITKIQFVPGEADLLCTYTLKVWQGVSPPTLIYEQELATVTADVWNEVVLDSPVPYDNNEELWFGFNVNTSGGYPAGCDPGPQDEGLGNMMYWNGAWTTLTALNATLTFNWAVKGYIELAKGATAQLDPIKGVSVVHQNSGTLASRTNKIDPPTISNAPESSRSLLGFNVYRNDEFLANTIDVFYSDLNLEAGDYFYSVKAVYDEGESEAVGPKGVSILAPPTLLSAEADYYGVQLDWMEGSSVPVESYISAKQLTSNVKPVLRKERNTTPVDPGIYLTRSGEAIGDSCENPDVAVLGANSAPGMPYWFEYTPSTDKAVTISSCLEGQNVDTDLEVYDACGGALIAANDDLNAACGPEPYASAVTFNALAGVSYKIFWIDTWATDAFDFTVDEADICEVTCPDGSLTEPELCGEDLNGGCNADVPAYTPITDGDVYCGTAFAYDGSRDTDWYELVLDAPKTITWSVTAEFPSLVFILNGTDGCGSYFTEASGSAGNCETAVATATVPPGVYWLWVGNQGFYGNPCGDYNDYVAEVTLEDAFLSYFNVFRDGVDIADAYGMGYYDMSVTNGETYCYTVSQVLDPAWETGVSNELCADVPLIPAMEVSPLALTETHLVPPTKITSQTVTITNTGAGVLDWNLAVSLVPLTDGSKAYCDASTTTEYEYISNVLCGSINNESIWQGGVADYTALSTTILVGDSEDILVTNGNTWAADLVTCWVDWNNDEVFDVGTDEEFILVTNDGANTFEGSIAVPEGTLAGSYRLRVRMTDGSIEIPAPCGVASYGEVEDYTIMVQEPSPDWFSADIFSGTLASGESTDVTVSFNSNGVETGLYSGGLTITGNDPLNPLAVVTADFEIVTAMGMLAGYVTDGTSRGPVQGVTITAEEIRTTAVTDENGYYEMELVIGDYTVSATKDGYVPQTVTPVTIVQDQTTQQDFMLDFTAPVLLSATGGFFDVALEWQGSAALANMTDQMGVSTSNFSEVDKSAIRAQKELLLQGPDKQINKEIKVTRGPGETCAEAVTAIEGANSCAGAPYWYEFTPANDMIVNISSCIDGQTADTRLYVYDACDGAQVAYNDDLYAACPYFNYASAVSFPATGGTSYKIFWDPYWESDPFDFILETEAISAGSTCGTAVPAVEGLNTSPEAPYWFEFTPAEDKAITISSCIDGQSIDTDVEVYDACGGTLVAANDDLLADCGAYQYASGVTFNALGGVTYKIKWIDTWSSSGFDFFIELNDICVVECPTGGIAEGEPCGEDLNGGCNAEIPVYSPIANGDVICGNVFANGVTRDTDWYELIIEEPKTISWTATAEFPVLIFIVKANSGNCLDYEILASITAQPCEVANLTATVPPGKYWLLVMPSVFEGIECGVYNNYVAELTTENAFLTYFNVYRNGEDIADVYGNSYLDSDVEQGNTYCYTVDQVFEPGMSTELSNELCADVVFPPEIATNPTELFEELEVGETSSQTLTLQNLGLGELNWDATIFVTGKGRSNSSTLNMYSEQTMVQAPADISEEAGVVPMPQGQSVPLAGTRDVLYDNGPLVTGECATTLDPESMVQAPATLYGSNFNNAGGYSVLDNFTVPAGGDWTIESLEFFGYQTNGGIPSTLDGVFVQVWNGSPLEGGTPIWGDQITNVLSSTDFSGIFRINSTGTCTTARAIMRVVAETPGLVLSPGDYWMEWSTTGTAASGPWVPPVSEAGVIPDGNALQGSTGVYSPVVSGGVGLDFPFIINGTSMAPWLAIDLTSGTVPANGSVDINVDFNAENLEVGTYTADIVFGSNDPFTPSLTVAVQLLVGAMTQNIVMPEGWSAWSSYIMNDQSMENMMMPVIDQMIVTQYFNQLYYPAYGINNMGNFTNAHGYLSKMTEEVTLPITGFMADPMVNLTEGWNVFPVLQDCPIAAADVFSALPGLVIAWDPVGNGIYYPAGNLFTLVDLNPGMAYWVKVDADVSYTYPGCTKSGGANSTSLRAVNNTNWNDVNYTPVNHAVVFDANAVVSLQAGDMIGAFTSNGWCAGLVEYNESTLGFNLFGDDMTTEMADGFVEGENLSYRLFRPATEEEFDIEVTYSFEAPNADGLFAINGLSVVTDLKLSPTSVGANLLNGLSIYPNPSSGVFNIALNNIDENINYVVLNAQGQEVYRGNLLESQELDLSAEPRGVYFIKFMNNGILGIEKLVIK